MFTSIDQPINQHAANEFKAYSPPTHKTT